MSSSCDMADSRLGFCTQTNYPACVWDTFTGSPVDGYTMLECAQRDVKGSFIAWEYSTSGSSALTPTMALPVSETDKTTESPSQTNTQSLASTQSATPTNQSGDLSMSDRINLGTALGIGLPATIAGIIAAWFTYRAWRIRKKGTLPVGDDDQSALLVNESETSGDDLKADSQSQVTVQPIELPPDGQHHELAA
ncbi:hypothetical protein F4677DRAFT_438441 [Hypoxylon crocopeplum]|nr:hypothetical protein F4677DRAFT_438441 [Hypoxylon crocopeplum]